jgi:anti-sigma B factor antagonist
VGEQIAGEHCIETTLFAKDLRGIDGVARRARAMCENRSMNRLSVEVERDGRSAVVRCAGKLVAGVNDLLYTEVSRVIPESKRVVLDLTELSYMDSMGLGTIIRLYVSAKAAGCELELVNIGPRIRELLGMTNLLSVFTVCGEHHVRIQ